MAEKPWSSNGLFSDGGVVARNPSPVGGVWAWCLVLGDQIAKSGSGFIPADDGSFVTNNLAEFAAAVLALEALPEGWKGHLCSDSQVTLGRLCWGWRLAGIPAGWARRGAKAIQRCERIEPLLLQGHPTAADLVRGTGAKRKLPVSKWNVWCDERCREQAAKARTLEAAIGGRR